MAFRTQNYTTIWCEDCNQRTIIEPALVFKLEDIKCTCKEVKVEAVKPRANNKAKESSKED